MGVREGLQNQLGMHFKFARNDGQGGWMDIAWKYSMEI
jgi:hypothetical protein